VKEYLLQPDDRGRNGERQCPSIWDCLRIHNAGVTQKGEMGGGGFLEYKLNSVFRSGGPKIGLIAVNESRRGDL